MLKKIILIYTSFIFQHTKVFQIFIFQDIKKNYLKVLEIVKNQNIILIDMLEEFKNIDNPLKIFPFKDDGHLNGFGYRIIANSIFKKKIN